MQRLLIIPHNFAMPMPEQAEASSADKRTYVFLQLSDLKIVDVFTDYYHYGLETEPGHEIWVHAKGEYLPGSGELRVRDVDIPLGLIQIVEAKTKEQCGGVVTYSPDGEFEPPHSSIRIHMLNHFSAIRGVSKTEYANS
jgi:hypothetical protein